MFKLKRYLKPFVFGVAMAVALLFIQALCDLNLPNYMSSIVDVGIMQNGVETAAPQAISAEGYSFMRAFMAQDEQALLDESYSVRAGTEKSASGKTYEELYPLAASADIYVLDDGLAEETLDRLDSAFGTATWTMFNILQSASEQNVTQSQVSQDSELSMADIDLSQLYPLAQMAAAMPEQAMDSARQSALALDDYVISQGATMMTGAFYEELGVDLSAFQRNYIIHVGLRMLLIALISGVVTILVSLLSARIAAGVAKNLRNDIFEKVENFSSEEFDRFSTASLITRSTNDVMQIQMLLTMGIRMICYAPLMAIGGTVMALRNSVSMGWIIATACCVLVGVILVMLIVVMPKFKVMQKFVDRLNLVARETLTGLMVIRAFGTTKFEEGRFDKANAELTAINLFVNRAMTFLMPVMMLIFNGISVLIIWAGAHQVADSSMQVGQMMAFMQYAMQIIMSFLFLAMLFVFIPRASVSAARISEVLDTELSILDPKSPKTLDPAKAGYLEFKNVSFRYTGAEEDVLKDISFTAYPGQTTAFIGSTGSGKSTLINLIPRFYDVTGGEILLSGVNVKDITLHELHSHIGYVPQKSVLMSGTIASNIRYGNEGATDGELQQAASVAQALDFITEKEDGFDSEIAQGGANVSGGQKQRLSIARALAVKPDIYIFDDSFSALDFKTDSALRAALAKHTGGSTVIIVAQRVSTIMSADQIFVLNDGEIIGRGTHQELLRSCPEYYEIASSQLSKEELENE